MANCFRDKAQRPNQGRSERAGRLSYHRYQWWDTFTVTGSGMNKWTPRCVFRGADGLRWPRLASDPSATSQRPTSSSVKEVVLRSDGRSLKPRELYGTEQAQIPAWLLPLATQEGAQDDDVGRDLSVGEFRDAGVLVDP
jgi:hypothetical protein